VRILFFSHYFPPEVNAPATRTYEHCVRWVRAGHDVTVVTGAPNCPDGVVFPGYRNTIRPQVESVDGVRVLRVWTYLAPNAGTFRRIANYVSFMLSATATSLRLPRPDVVIATSPQFFCGWTGVLAARLKRAPFILEIRDIWPESIRVVGAIQNRWLLYFLELLEQRMYCAATHIVAVGEGYRRNVVEKADVADRISVITNGVDLGRFVPCEPDVRFLRAWGLEGKFVCSYVGTIGMAHGLEVVIEAAKILRKKGRQDIGFCLVGDGALRDKLHRKAKEECVTDLVVFTGRQSSGDVPAILASSNACLIHLAKRELFGTVIPSKIFETLAMGRPIIAGVRGEARRIVMDAGAGIAMEPECPESLVAALETLAGNPALMRRLSQAGRQYVAKHYSRDVLARMFLQLSSRIAGVCLPKSAQEVQGDGTGVPIRKAA
jgi:glycosyltransferase involved in cell wall biosynthesis